MSALRLLTSNSVCQSQKHPGATQALYFCLRLKVCAQYEWSACKFCGVDERRMSIYKLGPVKANYLLDFHAGIYTEIINICFDWCCCDKRKEREKGAPKLWANTYYKVSRYNVFLNTLYLAYSVVCSCSVSFVLLAFGRILLCLMWHQNEIQAHRQWHISLYLLDEWCKSYWRERRVTQSKRIALPKKRQKNKSRDW